MSESGLPSRSLDQQAYSPISRYGQISISQQLARLEEIRTGGHRPSYRPAPSSPESQWGQIQEGFSQVESDLSWQLRQISSEEPSHPRRPLSPDQEGRSWVQEYREKQRMRKVAQEARAQAEADLQRLLKEREEAQARAQEQERLAAEAAERLRKLEEAEQETLRAAVRQQQRREQQLLNDQLAAAKSEAEKMAELLESFKNPPAIPSAPDDSDSSNQVTPAVPVVQISAKGQGKVEPVVAPDMPLPVASEQHLGVAPQLQTVMGDSLMPSRVFADKQRLSGQDATSKSAISSDRAQSDVVVESIPDGDATQPIRVSPIDSLADAADDRALADQLALASGSQPISSRKSTSTVTPALAVSTKPVVSNPSAQYAVHGERESLLRGNDQQYPAGLVDTVKPPLQPASVATKANASAGVVAKGESAEGAPVSTAAARAGSAVELFQQVLAQTRQGQTRVSAPAGTATVSATKNSAVPHGDQISPRPAPAPPVTSVRQSPGASFSPPSAHTAPIMPPLSAQIPVAEQTVSLTQNTLLADPGMAATTPTNRQLSPDPTGVPVVSVPAQEAISPRVATSAPVSPTAPSTSEKIAPPPTLEREESSERENSRWWQRKRKAKKAEAPEQEDTHYGASLEYREDQDEEEPLTFIQTFWRWTLRLSILLIIALGMVLTMDRPVISQTMGQDTVQPGIVDEVRVLQI
ncbi:hypothetical protein [Varibaculum vaginae]|uniref:hypothetical protein n=1 Tax=Varibaculum vaginae TaxID=2364797 RepID=UPI000F094657|nr:hypothetical protein [Varibaculum vaginae]